MKNTIILLAIFILLAGGAYFIVNNNGNTRSTINSADRNFAVKDIDQIGKIFIADRTGKTATLTRKGSSWQINGKYKVRKDAIETLLNTIQNVELSYIPPKAAIPHVVETLGTHGIKVEIYNQQNEAIRTYYVGGMTNEEEGTYMIMEGAEQPYVMHLPSLGGGLRVRFMLKEENWRDQHLFNVTPEEIDFVSVEYPKQKNKSFKLERSGKDFAITPFYGLTPEVTRPYKKGSAEEYLYGFEKFYAENFINTHRDRDSISQLIPFAILTLRNKKGETQTARFHPIRPLDNSGLPLTDDKVSTGTAVERYHVDHSNGDFYLIQQLLVGTAFWSYDSFFIE